MIFAGCVIENHFQLSGVSRLSQKVFGKHLALRGQLLIVIPSDKIRLTTLQPESICHGGGFSDVTALKQQLDLPKLHLYKAELLQVCAQLKRSQNGILLRQHDECRARQAAVDVKPEPEN